MKSLFNSLFLLVFLTSTASGTQYIIDLESEEKIQSNSWKVNPAASQSFSTCNSVYMVGGIDVATAGSSISKKYSSLDGGHNAIQYEFNLFAIGSWVQDSFTILFDSSAVVAVPNKITTTTSNDQCSGYPFISLYFKGTVLHSETSVTLSISTSLSADSPNFFGISNLKMKMITSSTPAAKLCRIPLSAISTEFGQQLREECYSKCSTSEVYTTCQLEFDGVSRCRPNIRCTSCQSLYSLQDGLCLKSCSKGQYLANNACKACPENCDTCDEKKCLVCSENYAKDVRSNCVFKCPEGQRYLKDGTCQTVTVEGYGDCTTPRALLNTDEKTTCDDIDFSSEIYSVTLDSSLLISQNDPSYNVTCKHGNSQKSFPITQITGYLSSMMNLIRSTNKSSLNGTEIYVETMASFFSNLLLDNKLCKPVVNHNSLLQLADSPIEFYNSYNILAKKDFLSSYNTLADDLYNLKMLRKGYNYLATCGASCRGIVEWAHDFKQGSCPRLKPKLMTLLQEWKISNLTLTNVEDLDKAMSLKHLNPYRSQNNLVDSLDGVCFTKHEQNSLCELNTVSIYCIDKLHIYLVK